MPTLYLVLSSFLILVSGQPSTVQHGCTFADDQYIYNVELLPESRDMVCPTQDVLMHSASATINNVNRMQDTINKLKELATSLEQRNAALRQNIESTLRELEDTQLAVADKLGRKYTIRGQNGANIGYMLA